MRILNLIIGIGDENYLRKFDNASAYPEIQVFSSEGLDEEPEQEKYFCAVCKSWLEYHKYLDISICLECYQQYDTKIQDTPISNKGFRIGPHHDISRYPKIDDEGVNIPFVKGINLDDQQGSNIQILRQSADGRIQHIRITDDCTSDDAIRKTRNMTSR